MHSVLKIDDMETVRPYSQLEEEIDFLRHQLEEAKETIEAIKNGEVDALVVNGKNGHELFTLTSADHTYRIFIEKMTEGAVTLNTSGVIIYSNTSFAAMVGESSAQVVSEPFETFVSPADINTFRFLIREGWHNDVKGEIALTKNNTIIPVQLSITTLKMSDADTLSIIVTDLTNQKESLQQLKLKNEELATMNLALESSNHDLQQFASVASHDLQEPLRKIQIFSHLLREKFHGEFTETPRQYIDKITSAAIRMKALIVDILNYSRLSAKDNPFEKTNIKALILELLEDLEFTIIDRNARVTVSDIPEIEVNKGQMRQLLQNMISNALKFSKKDCDPCIEIFHEIGGSKNDSSEKICHLHIRDNGIGFDKKHARTIFNLFEKLHSKDDYEGTGIGLAIAKKIVEKHRGNIQVFSSLGVGTEFVISLPLVQKSAGK